MRRGNIRAAYVGTLWNVLLPLAATPFLLRALGAEAYGLIGLGMLLQTMLSLVEVGLSSALSRSLAAESVRAEDPDVAAGMHDLVRTLETLYGGLALLAVVAVVASAPLVAQHWLQEHQLGLRVVEQSVMLMGALVAARFLSSLYGGGLAGLQRQVPLQATTVVFNTLGTVGAVGLTTLVLPDVRAYFAWIALVGFCTSAALRWQLRRALPTIGRPARNDWSQWRQVRRFALGMGSLAVMSLAVTQTDKVLLSTLLPLRDFGLYAIAANLAASVRLPLNPIQAVFYPRMTQLHVAGDQRALADAYGLASRLASAVVLPLGLTLAVFSFDILALWLGDRAVAQEMRVTTTLLVGGGTLLGALMMVPYTLSLAHGDPGITLRSHAVMTVLQVPVIIAATVSHGMVGAATAWCVLFVVYGPWYASRVHGRYLQGSHLRWLQVSVVRPGLAAGAAVLVVRAGVSGLEVRLELAVVYVPLAWAGAQWLAWKAAGLPGVRQSLLEPKTRTNPAAE